jgi:hypothetical protein
MCLLILKNVALSLLQVSLPTQYNGKNQDPVGALSGALARLQANRPLRELREIAKGVTKQLPEPIQVLAIVLSCSAGCLPVGLRGARADCSLECHACRKPQQRLTSMLVA